MKGGLPLIALATALAVACAKAEPIRDGPFDGGDEAGLDGAAEAAPDATADAAADSASDAVSDAPSTPGCQCGEPGCGSCPTVAQVAAGGYSIDATEVTNAAYGEFLGTSPKTSAQPAECAGNIGFQPNSGWPAAVDKQLHPVVDVAWCDARAYCF
ncbi:MAG TPA: SUMF1/EgtB/PvdO family nonheme iron enzyme, partial [Polyangiaceae bacterium]|nr:SUMF1/EgtB/PvdO family nonheme iron enzyme [Polyangiaceae bacterium]